MRVPTARPRSAICAMVENNAHMADLGLEVGARTALLSAAKAVRVVPHRHSLHRRLCRCCRPAWRPYRIYHSHVSDCCSYIILSQPRPPVPVPAASFLLSVATTTLTRLQRGKRKNPSPVHPSAGNYWCDGKSRTRHKQCAEPHLCRGGIHLSGNKSRIRIHCEEIYEALRE